MLTRPSGSSNSQLWLMLYIMMMMMMTISRQALPAVVYSLLNNWCLLDVSAQIEAVWWVPPLQYDSDGTYTWTQIQIIPDAKN